MIARAGHNTTTHMIGLGTLLLLRHPEQLERLKREPELIDRAVDELLRYLSPVQFAPSRVALEDVEVNGSAIRQGDGVFAVSASANRDPAVSFGYGIHRCLGQGLARIELQVAFLKLFDRFLRCGVRVIETDF